MAEIGDFEVGNFALFCCPDDDAAGAVVRDARVAPLGVAGREGRALGERQRERVARRVRALPEGEDPPHARARARLWDVDGRRRGDGVGGDGAVEAAARAAVLARRERGVEAVRGRRERAARLRVDAAPERVRDGVADGRPELGVGQRLERREILRRGARRDGREAVAGGPVFVGVVGRLRRHGLGPVLLPRHVGRKRAGARGDDEEVEPHELKR